MASLSKVTDGELTELKRVLAEAGLDTKMVRGFNKKPELAKPWVNYGRELLAGKATSGDGNAATQSKPKIFKRGDGSFGLKTRRLGLSDEQIVSDFKAAGWNYINQSIRSDRRLPVEGKPEIAVGATRTLKIASVVPSGSTWKLQKAVDAIGAPALAFDLEDLRNLVLEHRDDLMKRGAYWVVAPAARFRIDNSRGCVVSASLEDRLLYLDWVGGDWDSDDWFGSSK